MSDKATKKQRVLNLRSWRDFAKFWRQVDVPWRPTPDMQRIIENYAKRISRRIKNPKALICGSTVEFREILAKHKFEVTCLDISPVSYKAFGSLMHRRPFRETLKIRNWMAKPFVKNYFDLVLGDYITSNIRYNEQDKLFRNLRNYVKDSGFVILSFFIKHPKGQRINDLVKNFKKNPRYFDNFINKWDEVIRCSLEPGVYDKRIYSYRWHTYDKKLFNFVKKGILTEKEFDKLKAGVGRFTDCGAPRKNFEKRLKKYFKIIFIGNKGRHPIAKVLYTSVLRKK